MVVEVKKNMFVNLDHVNYFGKSFEHDGELVFYSGSYKLLYVDGLTSGVVDRCCGLIRRALMCNDPYVSLIGLTEGGDNGFG